MPRGQPRLEQLAVAAVPVSSSLSIGFNLVTVLTDTIGGSPLTNSTVYARVSEVVRLPFEITTENCIELAETVSAGIVNVDTPVAVVRDSVVESEIAVLLLSTHGVI